MEKGKQVEEKEEITVEQLEEMGDAALGLRIQVTGRNFVHVGIVNMLLDNRSFALEQMCNPRTGTRFPGLFFISLEKVVSITLLGEDVKARSRLLQDIYQEKQCGRQVLAKKIVPPHLADLNETCTMDEDLLLNRRSGKGDNAEVPPVPPPRIPRPQRWIIIESRDEAYKKALDLISKEKVIGVGMEGLQLGRGGSIAWVIVATSRVIFLFDIVKIGTVCIKEELGTLFTNEGILKVLHDSRPKEDLLFHKFNISMKNIFDTQAAEVYIHMQQNKDAAPTFVTGLPSLLVHYLNIPAQHLFFARVRQECLQKDEGIWLERPLPPRLCEGLAQSVMYLRELRLALIDQMLVDLVQLTAVFQGSFRDKDSSMLEMIEPHIVPEEVQQLCGGRSVLNRIRLHDPLIRPSPGLFRLKRV